MNLLKKLVQIHAPSGNEIRLKEFLKQYLEENKSRFAGNVQIFEGRNLQGGMVVSFGKPKMGVFSHIDSTGFMAGYSNELVKLGGVVFDKNTKVISPDLDPEVFGIKLKKGIPFVNTPKNIPRGTTFTFAPQFRQTKQFISSSYLDNRLGVFIALKLAERVSDFALCLSCYEEVGGGNAGVLAQFIHKEFHIFESLILDITWVTKGIKHNEGAVISLKDVAVPRKVFVDKIISIAEQENIPYQLEVEKSGGSDGTEIQRSLLPMDWCFIGPPEKNTHSEYEKVAIKDIQATIEFYEKILKFSPEI